MPKIYRDPNVRYRDVGTTYRGDVPAVPGIDLEHQGHIQVAVTDRLGNFLREVPGVTVDSVSWVLNGVGACQLSSTTLDDTAAYLLPGEREVRVVFLDTVRQDTGLGLPETWQGQVLGDQCVPGTVTFMGEEIMGYLLQREVENSSLIYSGIEQFSIAWDLITIAQTGANMNLGITAGFLPSGITRHKEYPRDQHPKILDALAEFSTLRDGFDHELYVDPTGIRQWVPSYPRRGVHRSDIVFSYDSAGGNIADYSRTRDVKPLATRVWSGGGVILGEKLEGSYEDTAASARFGVRVGNTSDGSVTDQTWLADRAYQEVQIKKDLAVDLSITIYNRFLQADNVTWDQYLGKIHVGDWYNVDINDGITQIQGEFRMGTLAWKDDDTLDIGFIKPGT